MNETGDFFACLEGKRVLLVENSPNDDSGRILAKATWCVTAPIRDDDRIVRLLSQTDVEAVVLNDALAHTIALTNLMHRLNQGLGPGGCLMICEPFWAIDPALENSRIQALINLRTEVHNHQCLPLWQSGQLYSIMQGLGLTSITFAPTTWDHEDPQAKLFRDRAHQLPPLSSPGVRIGRMRMCGYKPTPAP